MASTAKTCYWFYFVKKKFLYACAVLGKTAVSFAARALVCVCVCVCVRARAIACVSE